MLKVIIIDDEYIVRSGLRDTVNWTDYGMEVAGEAENGEEGILLAEKIRPDIIITDIYMPKMDGMDFINAIRAKNLQSEIIILSGYGEFSYAKQAISNAVSAYLLKPVDIDELTGALNAARDKILSGGAQGEFDLSVIRQKLIDDLLRKDWDGLERENYSKRYFGFSPGDMYSAVILVKFKSAGSITEKERFIRRVTEQKIKDNKDTYAFYTEYQSENAVLLFFSSEDAGNIAARKCAEKLREKAEWEGGGISIGISETKKGISNIKNQAETAHNLARHAETIGFAGYGGEGFKALSKIVSDALDYVAANYGNNITVEKTAEYIKISSSYLVKLLKQETGYTFNEYLTFLRINAAKKMIAEENYKVYEIADMIGYQDVKYFTGLFKKMTGRTPREYLAAYKAGEIS